MEGLQLSMPMKAIFSLFPTGALAALVVWFVYVIKYAENGEQPGDKSQQNSDKYTIAFQTIVAVVLLYFMLHHHMRLLML